LKEAYRVLRPGGTIMVGVPDLETLCQLFLHPQLDLTQRFNIVRMIYGGQTDPWDFHKCGFSFQVLGQFLFDAGFEDIRRVENFGLFEDTTSLAFEGVPISLNVIATKPLKDRAI
jgi:predicted SAM-dependent methyltransferase